MIPLRALNPRLFIAKLYHGIIDDDTGARLSFVPAVFNLWIHKGIHHFQLMIFDIKISR